MIRDVGERFWEKVNKTETCWLWTGSCLRKGYAQFRIDDKKYSVHRLSYEWLVGPIPAGLELDHLCKVRHCVNPKHLEPVTHVENIARGDYSNNGAWQTEKTHCPSGHEYNEKNTYIRPKGGRNCRVCQADWWKNKRHEKKVH